METPQEAQNRSIEPLLAKIRDIQTAADRFAGEMKAQCIHVGVGGAVVRCITCGKPWPCDSDRIDRDAS